MSTYIIGQGANIGIYQNTFRTVFDGGAVGGAGLRAIQQGANKQVFAILADGRLAVWGGKSWVPFPLICGVPLRSLAFARDGLLWCVSDGGKIVTVKSDGSGGTVLDRPWTLKMVTFDGAGTLWGVGQAGNLASWNDSKHAWDIKKQPWELKMIAYDADQALWCVGEAGNTGKWDNGTWVVQEIPWNNEWIAFMDV